MIKPDKSLSKVLVVSSMPFSKTMNNGKTLSSFFDGYDKEKIAQLAFSAGDCNPDVCDNYFFYTKNDVINGTLGAQYSANELTERIEPQRASHSRLFKFFNVFSLARNPLSLYIKSRVWDKADYSKANEWIDEFKPDLVFFQGFSMAYGYDFALSVCEKRNIPLILELTDDYTERLHPCSIFERANNKRYMRVFRKAIKYAYKTIVISDLMKEEYTARFGGEMVVMMNSVQAFSGSGEIARTDNDYVYAGNLLLNRWKVLRNLGKALLKINSSAILNIYTPDVPPKKILKALSKVSNIRYGGRLTKEQLEKRLAECEYVVHVEAFDKKNRKITRLSMSTKISEYVASGAKILAIGPQDVASMRCLADNRLGICVNDYSIEGIAKALVAMPVSDANTKENAERFICMSASCDNAERIRKIICQTVRVLKK